jgi:bleomycin hydrolase
MKKALIILFCLILTFNLTASDLSNDSIHEFNILKKVEYTPVKSQGRTGTCWSFATTSFIESELLRMGKGEHDLSEMYFVRNCYVPKAQRYIRYHGKNNFSEGGQAHDVMLAISMNGMVPEAVYSGKTYNQEMHNHSEMTKVLKGMLDGLLGSKKLTSQWQKAYNGVLDVYLGEDVETFEHEGETFTPESFTQSLEFNPQDYIEFTSYTHQPFYKKINLELPDNWTGDLYHNVPLNEFLEIMNNSINQGYSFVWDGDCGRDHFKRIEGYAVVPLDNQDNNEGPEKEKNITQEIRQVAFDNYDTTDDHLMHIVGIAENQNGTPFYYTKNSWGTNDKGFDGFYYMSEEYMKLKTVAILVHKDVVPEGIMAKFK